MIPDELRQQLRNLAVESFEPNRWEDSDQLARAHPMLEALIREALHMIPGGMKAVRAAVMLAVAAYELGKEEGGEGVELDRGRHVSAEPWPTDDQAPADGGTR
jgi:hypothetical protein